MRVALLAAGLLLALAGVAAAGASATRGTTRPALTVARTRPFEVHGLAFHARERVSVTLSLSSASSVVRRVRATAAGTFVTGFGTAAPSRCSGYVVTARGRAGSRAVLKLRPLCPPP
jgi:hypothetical protein